MSVNKELLEPASYFPYLGRTVTYKNSDWAALYKNLRKLQRQWGMLSKVVMNTGETVRSQGMIYMEIIQSVLLYGSASWLVTRSILKLLEGFHHWSARSIEGMA